MLEPAVRLQRYLSTTWSMPRGYHEQAHGFAEENRGTQLEELAIDICIGARYHYRGASLAATAIVALRTCQTDQ